LSPLFLGRLKYRAPGGSIEGFTVDKVCIMRTRKHIFNYKDKLFSLTETLNGKQQKNFNSPKIV
jgi:hypothetical protein